MIVGATDGDVTTRTCTFINGENERQNRCNLKRHVWLGPEGVQIQLFERQHHGVGCRREKLKSKAQSQKKIRVNKQTYKRVKGKRIDGSDKAARINGNDCVISDAKIDGANAFAILINADAARGGAIPRQAIGNNAHNQVIA